MRSAAIITLPASGARLRNYQVGNIDASEILDFYKARFQIEFIFRDAKQFTGLTDCQACDFTKLDFHFNSQLIQFAFCYAN